MKPPDPSTARKARISNMPSVQHALAERDAAHAEAARLTAISGHFCTPEAEQAARCAQARAAEAYDRHVQAWYEADTALHLGTEAVSDLESVRETYDREWPAWLSMTDIEPEAEI